MILLRLLDSETLELGIRWYMQRTLIPLYYMESIFLNQVRWLYVVNLRLSTSSLPRIHSFLVVCFCSVEPETSAEQRSLELGLQSLLLEDPSLNVTFNEETGQTLLSGMGELHLEIACERLFGDFHVKGTRGRVAISYRESLVAADGKKKSKKHVYTHQGREIELSVEPAERGSGNSFVVRCLLSFSFSALCPSLLFFYMTDL